MGKSSYFNLSLQFNQLEENMGFKNQDANLGVANLVLASSLKHNHSLKKMEKLNQSIDWH
jgi:hypothetical protein